MTKNSQKIKIKFFMDYICEWCCLGRGVLLTLQDRYKFDVEYHLVEIHPDTPENGMPFERHLRHPERWIAQMNQLGAPYQISFLDKKIFANTKNALILGQYAQKLGKINIYTDLLWQAYMQEGKNISSQETVKEIGYRAGISPFQAHEAFIDPHYYAGILKNQCLLQNYGTDLKMSGSGSGSDVLRGTSSRPLRGRLRCLRLFLLMPLKKPARGYKRFGRMD